MGNKHMCTRCLLDTEVPGITIGPDGQCSQCTQYDRDWGDWPQRRAERKAALDQILRKARQQGNRIYDCVIPLSGGKDSTYVLYYARKALGLKCLAVTFDNGLLTDHARRNIASACEKLEVDHLYYGLSRPLLLRLYRHFLLRTGFLCPVCMRGIQVAISTSQLAFHVPLAMRGTCRRTEEHISTEFFVPGDLGFIESVLEGTPLKQQAQVLLRPVGVFRSPHQIKLPDYIDWDYEEIFRTITQELGWRAATEEAEHSDCQASDAVHYFRWRKFPALIPERLRYSKLVTAGALSRQQAQRKIDEHGFVGQEPPNLDWLLSTLDVTRQQIDEALSDPLKHLKYFTKNRSRAKRRLVALAKRVFA